MVYLGMEPLSKFSIMQSIFKSASRRKTLGERGRRDGGPKMVGLNPWGVAYYGIDCRPCFEGGSKRNKGR
jgi:hypothetical protein